MTLVTSSKAHAKILSIDPSQALLCPGVKGFLSADDIPGSNVMGIGGDEQVFASDKVNKLTLFLLYI